MKEQQPQICLSKTKPVGSQSKQLEKSQLMGPSNPLSIQPKTFAFRIYNLNKM